jgi:CheY-like chemotaxis protein
MSQSGSSARNQDPATLSPPLVLVVDDNPVNQKVLVGVLQSAGIGTVTAADGLEALERAAKHKPDLVLLDVMMPDMDGYEVCRLLKRHVNTRDLPVIFLTVKSETADIVKGFESGGVDYVAKPFQSLELLARVRTHIELKRAREEIRTLRGIVPVCASCRSVRDEKGAWQTLEEFVRSHSEAEFSHGFCPSCLRRLYPDVADRVLDSVHKKDAGPAAVP